MKLTTTDVVSGTASGPLLCLDEPLSLWGGLDPTTGMITDVHHPQHGQAVTATVLKMPFGRGSSSASSVLVEAIRLGTAPAAFVLDQPDEILTLGVLVGYELYGTTTPIAVLHGDQSAVLKSGLPVQLSPQTLQI